MESNPWSVDSIEDFNFYNCPECEFKSKEAKDFKDHAVSNHPKSTELFSKSSKKKKKPIKIALKNYEQEKNCNQCTKSFASDALLNQHKNIKHRFIVCNECNTEMPLSKYRKHIASANCSRFSKEASEINFISDNPQMPQEAPPKEKSVFNCDKCSFQTDVKRQFLTHVAVRHSSDISEKTIDCPKCGIKFDANHGFVNHFRKVHGSYPPGYENTQKYYCDQCTEVFLSKPQLKMHVHKIHVLKPSKEFPCTECSEIFRFLKHLNHHYSKVHNMDPPNSEKFPCDDCPKVFFLKKSLVNHKLKIHSGKPKKTLNCPHCDKVYICRTGLDKHIRIYHDPENSHLISKAECKECNKKFKTGFLYNYHLKMVHNNPLLLKCETCTFRTKIQEKLDKHKCKNAKSEKVFFIVNV